MTDEEQHEFENFYQELLDKTLKNELNWTVDWARDGEKIYVVKSLTLALYKRKLFTRWGYYSHYLYLTWREAYKLKKAIQRQDKNTEVRKILSDIDRIRFSMNRE